MASEPTPDQPEEATHRIVCNPVDLPYRYQQVKAMTGGSRSVHREGADPTAVLFRGHYYLFVSMSRGFFHSPDLVHWEYKPTEKLPPLDYAPDARVIDDAIIITASRARKNCPFYRSENPLDDDFVEVTPGTFPFFDPNIFQDDDGSTYLYWGCSNRAPIRGVELDRTDFTKKGAEQELVWGNPSERGWERTGENYVRTPPKGVAQRMFYNLVGSAPFIEGSWMTKHDGTYYLQYAAPATETNSYADGYLTGTTPLGPFEYSPNSPFSSKPGGFMTGAGHGSTFADVHGNWWHVATMRVSVNHMFERRVGLFPAGFDSDGVLFCNQTFADYPMIVPDGTFDPWTETFAGWMLLSLNKPVTASSAAADHPATLTVNEDARTWWVAEKPGDDQWVQVDLGATYTIRALQINHADEDVVHTASLLSTEAWSAGAKRAIFAEHTAATVRIETSYDGTTWTTADDPRGSDRDAPHRFIVTAEPLTARYVRVTGVTTPFNSPFALSGIRVFGEAGGPAPTAVSPRAQRTHELTAEVSWEPATGAHGYTVRYGLSPEKLYHSWQVYNQNNLRVPTLNANSEYWVAVDSFGETGVTRGEPVPMVRG